MPSQMKMKQETSLSVVQLEITFGFIATKFHHVTCHTKLHIVYGSVTNNDEHLRSASQNHVWKGKFRTNSLSGSVTGQAGLIWPGLTFSTWASDPLLQAHRA